MKRPALSPRDRILFFRGAALGVVCMAGVTIAIDNFGASRVVEAEAERAVSAADKAADILGQAITLSDRVMNREISENEIPLIVTGALQALDPYSGYVEKEWTDRLTGETDIVSDSFMIGIVGEVTDAGYAVLSTMPLSPAERVGIRRGDVLTDVDGLDVSELPGAEARDALKEAAQAGGGSEMTLRFDRAGAEVEVSITPEHLPETFVYDLGVQDGILHLAVTSFMEGIARDAENMVQPYVDRGELQGIIFDLRGNTGGLTTEARLLAELVMPAGTLLYTEEGLHIETKEVMTAEDPTFTDLGLSVVVDSQSASASEIFASAIQANDLGLVYGEISFGKGTIQNVYPFSDGQGGIKITVGEYRDAQGRAINGIGVVPDVVVETKGALNLLDDLPIVQARKGMLDDRALTDVSKGDDQDG